MHSKLPPPTAKKKKRKQNNEVIEFSRAKLVLTSFLVFCRKLVGGR